jgi:hypothetical protein
VEPALWRDGAGRRRVTDMVTGELVTSRASNEEGERRGAT